MRKLTISCLAAALLIAACNKRHDTITTTTFYLDLPDKPAAYFSTKNGLSEQMAEQKNNVATLGRVLFYDTRLSVNNATSCGSCHKQSIGFADNAKFSRGFEGRITSRNSPGFNGLNINGFLFWDGRENDLSNLTMRPISNHVEMGIEDLSTLPAKLTAADYYYPLFEKAYGTGTITLDRIADAMSTFITSVGIVSMGKPMSGGSEEGLTAEQLQGKILFDTKYDCGSCHRGGGGSTGYGGSGPAGRMEDIGLDAAYTDKGRGVVTGLPTDMGRFKVPNLTNVSLTAPYMHDGRYNTLEEVLEHYSTGINTTPNLAAILRENEADPTSPARKMNISQTEKKAIIAFLKTLNDNNTNTDPKFSNPFKVK